MASLLGYFVTDTPPAGVGGPARPGGGLQLADVREARAAGTAGPDGSCILALDAVDTGSWWRVVRVIVLNDGLAVPAAVLYDGDPQPQNVLDGTADGNLDVSDTPFYVQSGRALTIRWTGAAAGSGCALRVQYELLVRT